MDFLSDERKAVKHEVTVSLLARFSEDIPDEADGLKIAVELWREELSLLFEIRVLRRALDNICKDAAVDGSQSSYVIEAITEIESEDAHG